VAMFSPGPRPPDLAQHLAWPVRVDPRGITGPSRAQSRSRRWRRTSQGLYVPTSVARTVDQRIVEAAAVLPAYGAVTGWAALRWLGGAWFDGSLGGGTIEQPVVLVTMDSSIRPQPCFVVSEERLAPEWILTRGGVRVTTPVYALLHLIRHAGSELEALIAADMAAYSDLVSRLELAALVAQSSGWIGIGRGRNVVDRMGENAWSPAEVSMREVWSVDAALPRPLCNRPVFDLSGRFLGTPDLIDPVAGVAGEYDSELHLEGARRRRDQERESLFRSAGLETVAMVTGELADPWPFIARLRAAYARATRRPLSDRRWTIEPPSWWTPTVTVDQRRALTERQRARWLRYRREAG
jgi:hypothetical protein